MRTLKWDKNYAIQVDFLKVKVRKRRVSGIREIWNDVGDIPLISEIIMKLMAAGNKKDNNDEDITADKPKDNKMEN